MIVRDKHSSRACRNPKVDESSGVYDAGFYVSQYSLAFRQNCVAELRTTAKHHLGILQRYCWSYFY